MTIQVHDSLTRTQRPFEPFEPGHVRMYVCGPTVYSDCHIGHLMGPVLFDAVARWLQARGLRVTFVNNITDIDDKIIQRACDTGESWQAIAQRYEQQYFDFLRQLGVRTVTEHPRCTEHVPQMITFVAELLEQGRAYVAGDGVYYEVGKQPGYGKLSGRRLEDMRAGARVDAASGLRDPADFALWKLSKPDEPSWPSPWGAGRPGWHLECSVMARELLGARFDLHGGGDDLKFPHHENEIAQSEAHGDPFAACWMHHGLAQYEGRKIAKSDPRMRDPEFARQFDARWLIDTYGAPALRFFLLRGHYRRPIDFEPGNLAGARTGLVRLLERLGGLAEEPPSGAAPEAQLADLLARELPGDALSRHRARYCAALDDDFNTGGAIAELFAIQNAAHALDGAEREDALRLLRDLGRLLGLFQPGDLAALREVGSGDERLTAVVSVVTALRAEARAAKDYATADALRDGLQSAGVRVHDDAGGAGGGTVEFAADGTAADARLDAVVRMMIEARSAARARKDFALADTVRDRLAAVGVQLLDGPDGTHYRLD